jgi:hypothetical protein
MSYNNCKQNKNWLDNIVSLHEIGLAIYEMLFKDQVYGGMIDKSSQCHFVS